MLGYAFNWSPEGVVNEYLNDCEVIEEARPFQVVNRFEQPFDADGQPWLFEGAPIKGGDLIALAEGFGLQRTTPSMRRFLGLAQLVLDPADPGVLSRHLARDPLVYPNKGDQTGARFLIVTTNGDMNVPAGSGVTVARAAGVIDYLNNDPRYGKPINQVLIDTHSIEAVNKFNRHPYKNLPASENIRKLLRIDSTGGAHVDIENFSEGNDIWGDNITRLDPGLRLLMTEDVQGNPLHGPSGAIFPFAIPEGQHGFPLPGEMTDWAIQLCKEENGSNAPQCAPEEIVGKAFDMGWYMFHVMGAYFNSQPELFNPACITRRACNNVPDYPEARDRTTLP